MVNWTVQEILDQIQELVGEPVGGYYNITTRLKLMNQAQREMVREARSLRDVVEIPIVANTTAYTFDADFLTYSKEQPYIKESTGNTRKLTVVDVDFMDRTIPGWRNSNNATGTPTHVIMIDNQSIELFPMPLTSSTLVVPYVPAPAELSDLDDTLFDGVPQLSEFALAVAYKVAGMYMLPRAPQLADQYLSSYGRLISEMRSAVNTNPQHHQYIRPTGYRRN